MSFFTAIILGLIEGLTEFFPISSTGHLIITEKLFHITNPSLFFNVTIQVGAILAAVFYYRKRIAAILQEAVKSLSIKTTLVIYAIATVPALVIGAGLNKTIERLQSSVTVVAVTTVGIALFLWWIQRTYAKTAHGIDGKKISIKDALIIGVYQAISVIPGVSRSGITIAGGLTRKLSLKDATDTAFLLAIPVMLAATAFEGLKLVKGGLGHQQLLLTQTAVGFAVAFVVALATISTMVPILKKYGFTPFIVYRLLLGVFILLFLR